MLGEKGHKTAMARGCWGLQGKVSKAFQEGRLRGGGRAMGAAGVLGSQERDLQARRP